MRTRDEFRLFIGRWMHYVGGKDHGEDDWEYFIPKFKMFEISRRLKSPTSYIIDFHHYTNGCSTISHVSIEMLTDDFYDFCKIMERNKKLLKLKKKIDGTE